LLAKLSVYAKEGVYTEKRYRAFFEVNHGGGMRTKQTPLHDFHLAHHARMVPFAGWDMPLHYPDGFKTEHLATRQSAGLFDVSHVAQLEISGDRAAADLAVA
jgi:glycine cleavage system aminomethyltransferase T